MQIFLLLDAARKAGKRFFAFYNCTCSFQLCLFPRTDKSCAEGGDRSGASQHHKHVQFMPVEDDGPPIEKVARTVKLESDCMRFLHFSLFPQILKRLTSESIHTQLPSLRNARPPASILALLIHPTRGTRGCARAGLHDAARPDVLHYAARHVAAGRASVVQRDPDAPAHVPCSSGRGGACARGDGRLAERQRARVRWDAAREERARAGGGEEGRCGDDSEECGLAERA